MSQAKILIVGASGLVGSAAMKLFAAKPEWEVVAASRRRPFIPLGKATYVPMDLLDEAVCRETFGRMRDVTHVVYAAVNEQESDIVGGWVDEAQIAKNAAMLRNLCEPLLAAAENFRHISIVHGMKAYGGHLGLDVPMPMKESLPRPPIRNFYFEQEDYIAAKQRGRDWGWTIFRAAMIAGDAIGSNMNSCLALAVFAALRKEAGLDLPMPAGNPLITDAADADLIALGLDWATAAPTAHNEIFNLVNGDLFAMHDGIRIAAECLDVKLGPPTRYDMVEELKRLAPLWPGMVRKYGLAAPEDFDALFGASLQLAGGWTADMPASAAIRYGLASTIKIRQAGFHHCVDTADMLRKYFRRYRELKLIPDFAPG